MNRCEDQVPDEFRAQSSWGSDASVGSIDLYLYALRLTPKDPNSPHRVRHSFGFLIENRIHNSPTMNVFLLTNDPSTEEKHYDATVKF
jgi:hypothetical protein